MTREEVLEMAYESGMIAGYEGEPDLLERFAALVAAAKREWQGLTDAEIDQITTRQWGRDFMVPAAGRAWGRAIEQALKEKNG